MLSEMLTEMRGASSHAGYARSTRVRARLIQLGESFRVRRETV